MIKATKQKSPTAKNFAQVGIKPYSNHRLYRKHTETDCTLWSPNDVLIFLLGFAKYLQQRFTSMFY